jgi:ABC-type siderophore export system fused ATPase/permease subunit
MKNFFLVFRIAIVTVLLAKIASLFLGFNAQTKEIINICMFSLIGVMYIIFGIAWDKKLAKTVIIGCGVYLIVMNVFPKNAVLSVIGIACILIPAFIGKFSKHTTKEESLTTG